MRAWAVAVCVALIITSLNASVAQTACLPPNWTSLPPNWVKVAVLLPDADIPANTQMVNCARKAMGIALAHDIGRTSRQWELTQDVGDGEQVTLQFDLIGAGVTSDTFLDTMDTLCFAGIDTCRPACNTSSLVFGPMQSDRVGPSAVVTNKLGFPQLSPTALPNLDNAMERAASDSFTTVAPSLQAEVFGLGFLCHHFGWKEIALVSGGNLFGIYKFLELGTFHDFKDAIISQHTFNNDDTLAQQLQDLSTGPGRVVVIVLQTTTNVTKLVNKLAELKMTGPHSRALPNQGWAVITTSNAMQSIAELPAATRANATGLLGFGVDIQASLYSELFERQWEQDSNNGYNCTGPPSMDARLVYDGIRLLQQGITLAMTQARAQGNLCTPADIVRRGTGGQSMSQILRSISFPGASGEVVLSSSGYRDVPYKIQNVQHGELVDVGVYLGNVTKVRFSSAVMWPSGFTSTPVDTTLVQETWFASTTQRATIIAYSCFNILTVIVFGAGIIVFRDLKAIKNSTPLLSAFILIGPLMDAVSDLLGAVYGGNSNSIAQVPGIGCKPLTAMHLIGYVITFSGVFSRTWRLHALAASVNKKKRNDGVQAEPSHLSLAAQPAASQHNLLRGGSSSGLSRGISAGLSSGLSRGASRAADLGSGVSRGVSRAELNSGLSSGVSTGRSRSSSSRSRSASRVMVRKRVIKDAEVWRVVGYVSLCFGVVMLLWLLFADFTLQPVTVTLATPSGDQTVIEQTYHQCLGKGAWHTVLNIARVLLKLGLLVWGGVLIVQTKSLSEQWMESESLFLGYAIFITFLAEGASLAVQDISVDASDLLTSNILCTSVPLVATMWLLFAPKFYAVYRNYRAEMRKRARRQNSGLPAVPSPRLGVHLNPYRQMDE